jgi:hypothetical protein
MTRLLLQLRWFVAAPAVVAVAAALAIGGNLLLSNYFERSFLDEADPLAATAGVDDGPQASSDPSPEASSTPVAAAAPIATSAAAAAGVLRQGEWRDGAPGHHGEGVAKIIRTEDGTLVLRLEAFSVTNGPDLFVVLSPDDDGYGDGSLTLSGLRATDGNINYDIPAGTDITRYRSAVIWCRGARVTFAYATLEDV